MGPFSLSVPVIASAIAQVWRSCKIGPVSRVEGSNACRFPSAFRFTGRRQVRTTASGHSEPSKCRSTEIRRLRIQNYIQCHTKAANQAFYGALFDRNSKAKEMLWSNKRHVVNAGPGNAGIAVGYDAGRWPMVSREISRSRRQGFLRDISAAPKVRRRCARIGWRSHADTAKRKAQTAPKFALG